MVMFYDIPGSKHELSSVGYSFYDNEICFVILMEKQCIIIKYINIQS